MLEYIDPDEDDTCDKNEYDDEDKMTTPRTATATIITTMTMNKTDQNKTEP